MSHNINMVNGVASIATAIEAPWHELGKVLPDYMTSEEAIREAHLDWNVVKVPVYGKVNDVFVPMDNKHITMRNDTGAFFGVVGKDYVPIQNVQAFEFFDSVVESKEAIYECCGALGDGETIWILANLQKDLRVADTDDVTKRYLLLTNVHDGTRALRMFFTPIRVVCQNTLSMAMSGRSASQGIIIRHTRMAQARVEQAKRLLGFVNSKYDEIEELYNVLASKELTGETEEVFYNRVFFGDYHPTEDMISKRRQNEVEACRDILDAPENRIKGIGGTLWAAYNSVTQYVDHNKVQYKTEEDPSRRLKDIWFGRGADMKVRAFETALDLAGVTDYKGVSLK